MPKWYAEQYAKKKKKEEETVQNKPQSPSVSQSQTQTKGPSQQKKEQVERRLSSVNDRIEQRNRRYGQTANNSAKRQERYDTDVPARSRTTPQKMTDTATGPKAKGRNSQDLLDAQAQKSGLQTPTLKEKQEANKAEMQKTALGRAVGNAPERFVNIVERYGVNVGTGLTDIGNQLAGADVSPNGRLASEMVSTSKERQAQTSAFKKWSEGATNDLMSLRDRLEKQQAEMTGKAKGLEKAYYGAEESYTGMGMDYALSKVTNTPWQLWLGLRSYGGELGKASAEGATQAEDRANAYKDAATEIATEMIGGVFGAAKLAPGRKLLTKFSDKVGAKLAQRLEGKVSRDVLSSAGRWGRNILEENIEEWVANPTENIGENLIFRNRIQAENEEQNEKYFTDLGESIQQQFADDPESVNTYIAMLNSPDTKQELVDNFKEGGMSDEQASSVSDKMIEFMAAAAENNPAKMQAIRDSLDEDLVGDVRKKVWDWEENLESAASTTLLMAVTGAGPAISTYNIGTDIKNDPKGREKMMNALRKTAAFDKENADKAQALLDSMEKDNYEPTATQAYDIMANESKTMNEVSKRYLAGEQVKADGIKRGDYRATPAVKDENGHYKLVGEETTRRYFESYTDTLEYLQALNDHKYREEDKYSSEEMDLFASLAASHKIGIMDVGEVTELSLEHPEARSVFQQITGTDLNQYNVYKNGKLDVAASNINMQEKLISASARNFIQSAKIEQEHWNDTTRGAASAQMAKSIGGKGSEAMTDALLKVDPRDKNLFEQTGYAVNRVYDYAIHTNDTWEDVRRDFMSQYKGVNEESLKAAFDAGKEEKAISENKFHNRAVRAGEAMNKMSLSETANAAAIEVVNNSGRVIGAEDLAFLQRMSNIFNVRIEAIDLAPVDITDDQGRVIGKQIQEGYFNPRTNTLTYNVNESVVKAFRHVISHELTHNNIFAPEEFLTLLNYIGDAWYKADPEGYKAAIASVKNTYKSTQTLDDLGALEEIVADGSIDFEFWNDEDLANRLAQEQPETANKFLAAIRELLRKIREFIASKPVTAKDNGEYSALYAAAIDMSEAERLMLNAIKAANRAKAQQTLDDWQDAVNEQNAEPRYSISKIVGASGKDYGIGVVLDSEVLEGKSEWEQIDLMEDIVKDFAGDSFITKDENGDYVEITIAPNKYFTNKSGKRRKAYQDLAGKNIGQSIKRESVALADEMIVASKKIPGGESDAKYPHGWIDNYGKNKWQYRTVYIQDRDGAVYSAVLNIATTAAGEKVLYDIDKFDEIEKAEGSVKSETTSADKTLPLSKPDVNIKFSISRQQDADYMAAVNSGDMETAQRMVDEAAETFMSQSKVRADNGELLLMHHGSVEDFTTFDKEQIRPVDYDAYYNGFWFSSDPETMPAFRGASFTKDVFLNITNPAPREVWLKVNKDIIKDKTLREESRSYNDELRLRLQDMGYDGIHHDGPYLFTEENVREYNETGTTTFTAANGYVYDLTKSEYDDARLYPHGSLNEIMPFESAEDFLEQNNNEYRKEDVWVAFEPTQIKSADPVTYDDDGNVIPLSERFQPENADIRFSISTEDRQALNDEGLDVTEGGSVFKYSLASWNDTDQDALLNRLVAAGFEKKVAEKWLDDVNSVASIILADMGKLNYVADRYQPALKPNSEYYYTLDLSTLCQKRRLYQGTYNAIMDKIVNYGLKPADTVRLRKMMADMKHEVPCGICYEESRKKNEGKFAETWLNGQTEKEWNQKLKEYDKKVAEYQKKLNEYNALEDKGKKKPPKEPKKPERWLGYANMEHTDPYIPTIADVTTTTGRDRLRQEGHLEALEAYLDYQKGRGSANPKVSFTHTDYRGDIMNLSDNDIEKVKHIGGLRIQSFSDFETVHVIDMMQAIMDMASRKLTAQAYTKVPAFADIFGGTGVKINLSLIQKMDENGKPVYDSKGRLVFDPIEGINPEEAFRIRTKYSNNVGTILVGVSRQQILDAWADDRVDMVIPFHRSGWSLEEFEKLGLKGYEDFQAYQAEAFWDAKQKKYISLKDAKMEGIYPADYWDDKLSGTENAKKYLELCAKKHYRPVFYNFLHDNGNGTWSLPTEKVDGYNADGYWKSLIDYKMYNNKGEDVSRQSEVQPNFDMEVAQRVMSEYEGNADTLPVAKDVVEAYLKDYKKRYPKAKIKIDDDVRLSLSVNYDEPYMDAVNSDNMEEAQKYVEQAATDAGFGLKVYHGTRSEEPFYKFMRPSENTYTYSSGSGFIYASPDYDYAEGYSIQPDEEFEEWSEEGRVMEGFINTDNMFDIGNVDDEAFKRIPVQTNDGSYVYKDVDWPDYYDEETINKAASDQLVALAKLVDKTPYEFIHLYDEDVYDEIGNAMASVYDFVNNPVFADLVKERGYDGIKLEEWGTEAYGVLESNQFKSADTVTYAEDGSVIPLSERFDPTNNDIRYSLSTTDSEGRVLSDGQMEYFKDSKARDEQGRLVPVYHTTNHGGFTVFDPMRSDDNRSLFFSSSLDVSQTYGTNANKPIEYLSDEEQLLVDEFPFIAGNDLESKAKRQQGYYKCYLNLENPLIVDAHGSSWRMISSSDVVPETNKLLDASETIFTRVLSIPKVVGPYDRFIAARGYRKHRSDYGEYWEEFNEHADAMLDDLPFGITREYLDYIDIMKEGNEYKSENGDYFDENGKLLDPEEYGASDEALSLLHGYGIFDANLTTRDVAWIAQNEGHDGVIIKSLVDIGGSSEFKGSSKHSDIYIAFSSNQVKDINNENPTENPDIRYSIASKDEVLGYTMRRAESITDIPLQDALLEDNRVKYSLASTNFENSIISTWDTRTRNLAKDVNETPLRRNLIRLMKQVRKDSGTERQYSTETIEETIRSIKKMYYYAKGNKAKDFAREAWDAAERIVGDINYDDVLYLKYKGISDYFADTEIRVPEEMLDDDTFVQFAKTNAGRIRLFADEGIEIEDAWRPLHNKYPDLFPEAAFVMDSPIGMLIQMDYVLNKIEPYKEAYTSEAHSNLIEDIANNLCNIVDEGSEYYSTINELNVKAMRQRHNEAIQKIKEEEKLKRDNQAERAEKWKQKYNERVEKNKADKEAGKQKKTTAKLVGDIEKNIKWLSDRLRPETRTKDNAIPEQFRSALASLLSEFDLQSKGSKKIEKKKGYPSKATLKMRQLREQYAAIAKENDDDGNNVFRYNGDLLVKMDELINTMESLDKFFDKHYGREVTIADLSISEMFIIDTMLKSLVHEFREYKNVTVENKRAEIKDVSGEVIGDMDTQIKRHGAAREGGALGKASGLLNMAEVTPIYFFKRLGAMFKMYREVRKGFDKYIENDREVINRLSKIMSGYYNKKNPGTTIESWRTTEDAQTFNFEHGPITLSVAQMMEVYLYANRPQAYGHMIGDGIIITPISPVGKIESAKEKLLGHEPMVDPVRLTYENVQEIISKLSKEQIDMADKLQDLVAGYMSDLGNETTMKMYGYKMFDDPNYFGIHVSQTAMASNVDAPTLTETIKNFGWTKPLTPGAKNTIVIGDIFTDVAKYCNEMNQFNAYAVPVSDFMRVYNYKLRDEDGNLIGSAKSAIIKAFGKQAHTYIMNFMRDLNGASMRRNGGLEGLIDAALGRAKKAAVFMNMRVALQQPTAIVRALAQMNAKYFLGVRPSRKATQEMIEHCPIAQWKAWGFYDTHFGRDVEDLIMNNWSKADVVGSWMYGALDNMTWGMIWQAVKNEVKAKNPNVKEGTQEFWDLCNDRASFVFDSTQVVDSPFHRSDAMRSKDTLVKQFTSFQSEPTLSFNVIRDFIVQAYDAVADGDKGKAAKLISQGVGVWTLQAAVVAVAQSLWDAVRHKNPNGDDDEDRFLQLWWLNFMSDFADDLKFYNNIYFIKEFTPYAEKLVDYMRTGKWSTYDNNKLLMFQGAENMAQGLMQIMKKIEKGDEYKHKNGEPYTWYEVMTSFLGGIGYLAGIPAGTVMRDAQSILKWFNIEALALDTMDSIANKMGYRPADRSSESKPEKASEEKTSKKAEKAKKTETDARLQEYREGLSDNYSDEQKDKLVKQYKKNLEAESEVEISEDFSVKEHAQQGVTDFEYEMEKRSLKAAESAAGKTGNARNNALWDVIAEGYTKSVESGNMGTIQAMRDAFVANGGDTEWFDAKITDKMKSAYKKTINAEVTPGASARQENMQNYLTTHGVSEQEISEIVRSTATARDLKAALRMGMEEYILDELTPLVRAGLTYEDLEYLYKYRNYGAKDYDGKYTDPKYMISTGTFVWPTDGVITSHFGYRNAPTRGASSNHPAIDIGAPMGTPVTAADGGVVIYAGSNGGYGNSVGIKHDNGMVTYYNHLSAWNVNVGDRVGQGMQIANVGSTGISTGPHLDFKILDKNGKPVDPEKYLNKRS